MKKITGIMILPLLASVLYAKEYKEELKYYDNMFEAIGQQRTGLSKSQLDSLISPFYEPKSNTVQQNSSSDSNQTSSRVQESTKNYVLYGIVQNRAKINESWYAVGDNLDGYTLSKINKSGATLTMFNKTIELKLNDKGNSNVIISY